MDATFEKTIKDRFGTEIGNGLVKYEIEGIDPDTTTEHAIVTHINTPMGTNQYMYIFTYFYGNKTEIAHRMQMAFPYNGKGSEYHRYFADGAWTDWRRHINEDEITSRFAGIASSQGLPNRPPGASDYFRCMTFDQGSNGDKYYLFIDSLGKLFTGRALNGDTTITWAEK